MIKNSTFILLLFSLFLGTSCKHINDKNNISNNDSTDVKPSEIENKEIYNIATSIIQNAKNDLIWNLTDVDSVPQLDVYDYFNNNEVKNRLVLMSGHAGLSSGTADNLLILFDNDSSKAIFACQTGNISPEDIKDLNNDGIKELISKSYSIYMGECNDNVNIFNLKNNKQNPIYTSFSKSVIECGLENINSTYSQGDTLEEKYDYTLKSTIKNTYFLEQLKITKIHNGGKNNAEIIKNLNITYENKNINF